MERLIKRYRNRKMYDTVARQYVNSADIEKMIRSNESIRVIDNVSGEDITRQILIQLLMRNEPKQSETSVPLDGLKDMLQSNESPIFQAFKNVLNLGKDVVQQISTRIVPESDQINPPVRPIPVWLDMIKHLMERISESTVRIVDGTLARELLKVPKRDDWTRIEGKLAALEQKLKFLQQQGIGGTEDGRE